MPVSDCGSEGCFLVNRFAAGVDHPAADGRVLGPGGNEPPAQEGGPDAGIRSPDGQDLLDGRDVVARRKITEDFDTKDLDKQFWGYGKGKSSAHESSECSSLFSNVSKLVYRSEFL